MTPLDTFLFCLLTSIISIIGTICLLTKKFPTKSECELKHVNVGIEFLKIADSIDKMCGTQDLMFRMLRGVIVHLEIPKEEVERLLNMPKNSK